ncbi:MAG TPA: CDP-alcohol phosphatidyltransferase family protein [archaeon]|nr:CDP-alcohol phosphatidyltransferase family protein [archaeon]
MVKLFGNLRAKYEAAIQPVGKFLGRTGVTPNGISTLSLMIAALAGVLYASRSPVLGAVVLLISGAVDMLDGAVARATGSVSPFGAVYDPVLDRYAEFAVLFGMGVGGLAPWPWVVFGLFGMVIASYTRARAESAGGLKSCRVGIAERQEKIILLAIGSFLQPFFSLAVSLSVLVVGILSHITVVQRLHFTMTQTRGSSGHV